MDEDELIEIRTQKMKEARKRAIATKGRKTVRDANLEDMHNQQAEKKRKKVS